MGEGPDVVFVAVCDHDSAKILTLSVQPFEIRMHELGTSFIGEPDSAVDGHGRVAAGDRGTVHAYFVEATEGDET
jgi:hypothetical protein